MKRKIAVIGAGFSGLSAATFLAEKGHQVHVYEKNDSIGGRARQFADEGFIFDMGPSWYWMPDVFERYFKHFGKEVEEMYDLRKLSTSFRIYFGNNDKLDVPESMDDLAVIFENVEKGAGEKLKKFLGEAEYKYKVSMKDLIRKPGHSIFEFISKETIVGVTKLQLFSSFKNHVRNYFTNPKLLALMEFPILFLGAMPKDTPALYSLMNYAGLSLGTYYPVGGFGKIIEAMEKLAIQKGVTIHKGANVKRLPVEKGNIQSIQVNNLEIQVDAVVASADYHHIEQEILEEKYRTYSKSYWDSRTLAPSSLIFYLGVDKKLPSLEHHNLFFHSDFDGHAKEIYENPAWPTDPLFYVCCPSKTDETVAPKGKENLFILLPIAPDITDTEELREQYFKSTLKKLEEITGESIEEHIIYNKSYCAKDFKEDYNSYKGNAYGLANTLNQTAFLKPKIKSKKVNNLFYTGHLTVPGPGVPPSLISGEIVANELLKQLS